jgi:hypothetical protein
MHVRRLTLSLALIALTALASPAGALAQSAGDDQYTDPFGQVEDPRDEAPGGSGQDSQDPGTAAPSPAPKTGATVPGDEAEAAPAAAQPEGGVLPRTGMPAGLAAGAGGALLAAGALLRRRT